MNAGPAEVLSARLSGALRRDRHSHPVSVIPPAGLTAGADKMSTVPEWDVSLKGRLVQQARVLLLAPERFQHRKVTQELIAGALGLCFQHF